MKLLLTLLALMLLVSCETKVTEASDTINVSNGQVNAIFVRADSIYYTSAYTLTGKEDKRLLSLKDELVVNTSTNPWSGKKRTGNTWYPIRATIEMYK